MNSGIRFVPLPKTVVEDCKKSEDLSGNSGRLGMIQIRGMDRSMKGSFDSGKNGRGQVLEKRFRAKRFLLLEIEDEGEGRGFHGLDESVERLRGEVKEGTPHDRLFVQASCLDSPAPQVEQELGMGMLVGSDFVALLGMLVVGESLDLEPCEGQGEILQEYGL